MLYHFQPSEISLPGLFFNIKLTLAFGWCNFDITISRGYFNLNRTIMKCFLRTSFLALLFLGLIPIIHSCKKQEVPTLTTSAITNITGTSATSGGNITSDGGSSVYGRGVCWSTSTNPVFAGNKTVDGNGTGIFTSSITGLCGNTIYYVRAYATNRFGTTYGNEISFNTAFGLATITTSQISNISYTTAISGGNVSNDGGTAVTEHGVCWNISGNPVISDNHTIDGIGSGAFPSNITGLNIATLYYVRAYATNNAGTAYGNQVSFRTDDMILFNPNLTYGTVIDIDGNTYKTIQIGAQTWMAENLKTTKYESGTPIHLAIDDAIWGYTVDPAYCWYNNDIQYKKAYGALYNWYTVLSNPCPAGWHVPTRDEWTTLASYVVPAGQPVELTAGYFLKEDGTTHWSSYNYANNKFGFTAIPAGWRYINAFYSIGLENSLWSSTDYGALGQAWFRALTGTAKFVEDHNGKNLGFSVRCIKND